MHSVVKSAIERVAAHGGLAWAARHHRRTRALVLAYHNIVPDGAGASGERALHLAQRRFARQLDLLSKTHDVVPVPQLMGQGTGQRPRAAITFDDAYRGAVTAGVDEAVQRGLPVTIFVAPAFVGDGAFWWDTLADPHTGLLEASVREHSLHALAGRDEDIRAWAAAQGLRFVTPLDHACVASEEELASAAARPGVTLAAHSWSHPNLARLNPDEVDSELGRPAAWLEERFPGALRWLAYPYGLATPAVREAARAAGYDGAMLVSGGWLSRDPTRTPFSLPRLNIAAGLSDAGFVLRTSGLLT